MPARSEPPDEKPSEKPHYHGHRKRLGERFRSGGPDALADYELLEMILFSARPQGDTKPAAKALLNGSARSPRPSTPRKRCCARSTAVESPPHISSS
jgi:hypothetical protein